MVAVFESAAAPTKKAEVWTEQKLMQLPDDGNVYELVGGELAISQAGFEHGDIGAEILSELRRQVKTHKLGTVVGASTGFWMKTGNSRSPDVSFVSKERLRGRRSDDLLDGEQIIPGFTFPVADLFAEFDFETEPLEAEEVFDEED